jgi:hypothetical protein
MLTKSVTTTFHVERGGSKRKHLGLVPFALVAFGVGSLALLSVPGSRASVAIDPHSGVTSGSTIPDRSLPTEEAFQGFRWEGLSLPGVLTVDGKEVARKTIPYPTPLLIPPDEAFDIGLDTRRPADFTYEVPFRITRTIDNLNYKLQPRTKETTP